MVINEGNLQFDFIDSITPIKFDDSSFYRKHFQKFTMSKGVDFLAIDKRKLWLIEVKNCLGYEIQNKKRLEISSTKLESFDDEIAHKVAMSIACLVGAERNSSDNSLKNFSDEIINRELMVILILEGNFECSTPSRSKKMIMKRIKDSIDKKLKWLNCKVFVEDIKTHKNNIFYISHIKE